MYLDMSKFSNGKSMQFCIFLFPSAENRLNVTIKIAGRFQNTIRFCISSFNPVFSFIHAFSPSNISGDTNASKHPYNVCSPRFSGIGKSNMKKCSGFNACVFFPSNDSNCDT